MPEHPRNSLPTEATNRIARLSLPLGFLCTMNWKLLTRLVVSQMLLHPGRAIVTTIGIVASTCAVVWVVSGYDALISQFDENARKYLGRYDALIIPAGPPAHPGQSTNRSWNRFAATPA